MIGTVLLSGCAETVYRTNFEVYCPPIPKYSGKWNQQLADELDGLGNEYTAIPQAVSDYAKMRDRIRICEKEKGKL